MARWLTDGATAQATERAPEPDLEYLMWQTLAGAWLIGGERAASYLGKAMHEAKTRTSWTVPRAGYESAVLGLADAVTSDPELTAAIASFVARIAPDARVNSLGAKLVQLTMPGVADIYQGCELTGLSLVDPDNRRPVDYQRRRRLLTALEAWPGPGGRPGRGEIARDLPRPAAPPGSSGLVRWGLRPARLRGPGRRARGGLPARRARGHRRHPAAGRAAAPRRLGGHRPAAARNPLARRADRRQARRPAAAAGRADLAAPGGAARPRAGLRPRAGPDAPPATRDDPLHRLGPRRQPGRGRGRGPAVRHDPGEHREPAEHRAGYRLVECGRARHVGRHRLRVSPGRRRAPGRSPVAAAAVRHPGPEPHL